ncbi:unnamed protein product [Arctogadus glacialis]
MMESCYDGRNPPGRRLSQMSRCTLTLRLGVRADTRPAADSGLSPAGVARHRSACWQGDLTIAALPAVPALKGSRGGVPGWGGEGPQSRGAG